MSRIYLSPPDMGAAERTLLLQAFDSGWIAPMGEHVDAFERELAHTCGVRRAVAVSSGTAALHLGLRLAGVGPGDVVLVPSLTFIASVSPVVQLGARPVFVDCSPETWTVDPELLRGALADLAARGERVAAVVTVDLYGQACDYDEVLGVCNEFDVPVVQDAAEALGGVHRGRPVGSQGRVATLSFNGNKVITTSGGGALLTDDDDLADRAQHLATQAREAVRHYEHRDIGYNYRLSNLLAAVGRGQLARLDERVKKRRRVFERYAAEFAHVEWLRMMPLAEYGVSSCWLSCVVMEPAPGRSPDTVCDALDRRGIEARPIWKPLHLQPALRGAETFGGGVCEDIFRRGVCLPSGSALTDEQQDRVIESVLEARR